MEKYVEILKDFFAPLSVPQRIMFVGLVMVVFAIVGGLFYWSQKKDPALLFGSLQPEVAQEIVDQLNERGIKYQLQEGGRAIYVDEEKVHELRLEMAPMGGGFSDVKGYELFDANALGMTDFMQQVNKKRALEGELARSINSLEQVEFSRIHLVLPERSPFEDNVVEASASVILTLKKGKGLSTKQIEGITSLIAGSVEGLEPGNVTVLDQAGNRLTNEIDYDSEFSFGSTQMQLRQKTEAYLTDRGQTMLDRVLGAGNSILRVSVEHDFDRLIRESDLIDPDSRTIISEEKRQQTSNNEESEPSVNAQYTQGENAIVVASVDNESLIQTRNYEVNRTREVFEKTQGEIKYLSASVLLNYKRVVQTDERGRETIVNEAYTPMEVEQFREVVELALGVQEERGDELTIKQVEFFEQPFIEGDNSFLAPSNERDNMFRWIVIGITFLVVLFLINSIRRKMSGEDLKTLSNFQRDEELMEGARPGALTDGSSADRMLEGIDMESEGISQALSNANNKPDEKKYSKEEIQSFVERKPAEAAQVMRALIAAD